MNQKFNVIQNETNKIGMTVHIIYLMIALKREKKANQNGYEYFSSFRKRISDEKSRDKLLHHKDYYSKPPVKI